MTQCRSASHSQQRFGQLHFSVGNLGFRQPFFCWMDSLQSSAICFALCLSRVPPVLGLPAGSLFTAPLEHRCSAGRLFPSLCTMRLRETRLQVTAIYCICMLKPRRKGF